MSGGICDDYRRSLLIKIAFEFKELNLHSNGREFAVDLCNDEAEHNKFVAPSFEAH